jgi:hypothetical protein
MDGSDFVKDGWQAGLWRITTCTATFTGGTAGSVSSSGVVTIGSANTAVTVSNAFSADYDAYKIVLSGGAGSTNISLSFQFAPTSVTGYNANYYAVTLFGGYAGVAPATAGTNNGTLIPNVGFVRGADGFHCAFEVVNPFLAKNAFLTGGYSGADAGVTSGHQRNNGQYTGFAIICPSGNITGGTIRVYGYNI